MRCPYLNNMGESEIDVKKLLKILPDLIRNNDEVKGAIISALAGVIATKEDIKEQNERMDKRFEAMDRKWDKRFEALTKEMDKRFEAMDRKWDKRFEAMDRKWDKRFEAMDQKMDKIDTKLDNLLLNFGKPFEQFCRNVVTRILAGENIEGVRLKPRTFDDPNHLVFEETTDIEIDGFSLEPPILVEITTLLQDKTKIDKFLKKKAFLEEKFDTPFRGFVVASVSKFTQEEKADLLVLLKKHNSELVNL